MEWREFITPIFWQLTDAKKRGDKEAEMYLRGFLMGAISLLGVKGEISADQTMRMTAEIFSE